MDSILSIKNRTKKRKDNQKNKIILNPIQINKARYVEDYSIEIEFNDKTVQVLDFGNFLKKHPHPQYNKYNDIELFKQFKIEGGNLVWGDNWDLIFPLAELHKGMIKI